MYLTHLDCPRCGKEHAADRLQNLCECGSPLLARYDLAAVATAVTPERVRAAPGRPVALPGAAAGRRPRHVTTLGEGWTPLLRAPAYGAEIGIPDLMVKDEGLIPTGSFKARGAAVGREPGPRAGRRADRDAHQRQRGRGLGHVRGAGRAWARQSPCRWTAPTICRRECVAAGADLRLVDGLISDAGRRVGRADRRVGRGDLRRRHAARALPAGGQEDDGRGDRRAARLAGAGRDHLSDRRRGRA